MSHPCADGHPPTVLDVPAAKPMRESVEERARQLLRDEGLICSVEFIAELLLSERRKGWEMAREAAAQFVDGYHWCGPVDDALMSVAEDVRSLPFPEDKA